MVTNDMRLADDVVVSWSQRLSSPMSKIDTDSLRANIAQALRVVIDEKDKEIAGLKARLEIVQGTAREALKEGDRNV